MKFLCDQCHAKYQIADDKIAGKTLRMKCRRCGHDIELKGILESSDHHVAADRPRTLTGSSVMPATGLSGEVRTDSVRPRATTGAHDAAPRPRTGSGAPDPSRVRTSSDSHAVPPDPRVRTSSGTHDAGVRARTASASHPTGLTTQDVRERVQTGAPRPPTTGPKPTTGRFGTQDPSSGREPTGTGKTDALGAGFQRSMQAGRSTDAERKSVPPAGDGWYVAIQDVPVGPVSKDEIAKRIRAGDVRGGSLCWCEGFDDWRPLEDVAELAPLLRREREPTGRVPPPVPPSGGRPPTGSFATASRGGPASGSIGTRPPTGRFAAASRPAASSSSDAPRARTETPAPIESGPRGKVVPIGGRLGGAAAAPRYEPSIESPTVIDPLADELSPLVREPSMSFSTASHSDVAMASASPSQPAPPLRAQAIEPPVASAAAASVAIASIPPGASFSVSAPASSSILVPPQSVPVQVQVQSRGLPTGAWIAIVGAAAFGIALAIVVGVRLTAPTAVATAPTPTRETVREAVHETPPPSAPTPPVPSPTQQEAAIEIPTDPVAAPTTPEATAANGATNGSRRSSEGTSGSSSRGGSTSSGGSSSSTPAGAGTSTAGTRPGKQRPLTEDQRAALAAASGGSDVAGTTASSLRVQDRILGSGGGGGGGGSAPLTDEAVASAVARNKPSLRACYERSVRGVSQEAMTRFRVAFSITIGASGAVTRVSVSGAPGALPGLEDCFSRTIRRWRFPASGGSSRTEFTAVFQPGG